MFFFQPYGHTLIRKDGQRENRIRGDLIPSDTLVIKHSGRCFIRTKERDEDRFVIWREDHRTHHYRSFGE